MSEKKKKPVKNQVIMGCLHIAKLPVSDAAQRISLAAECGVTYFDMAYMYAKGRSEEVFGEAFGQTGLRREDVTLQSKAGTFMDRGYFGFDWSCDTIVSAVEITLGRLHTEYLDVLLLHRPDPLY